MAIKDYLKLVLGALASSTAVAVALPQSEVSPSPDVSSNLINAILTNGAGVGNPPRFKEYDVLTPVPGHTCARDFLAALASWSEFCGWDGTHYKYGGEDAILVPTLVDCCGYWLNAEDEKKWTNDTISDVKLGKRLVIATDPDDFRTEMKACAPWRHTTEVQYEYYMVNLENYGLHDIPAPEEFEFSHSHNQ